MRVLLRSRSRCLFTRSMVPHMCSCMRGCVHAPRMRARVYNSEVGVRGNREKGMKGGTITVPRFRATTRRHPFNLHPRCRVLNQPAISLPLLSPFQLLLSPYPWYSPRILFYVFSSFSSFTCRDGNPRSCREKRGYQANRLFDCIGKKGEARIVKALFVQRYRFASIIIWCLDTQL